MSDSITRAGAGSDSERTLGERQADGDRATGSGSEPESEKERLDRELIELLNELRVALPGVQVLFAFLLTLPFTGGFAALTDVQRIVYMAAFLDTGLASALLIAPTAYHRIRWRQQDKENMLRTANRMAIAGMAALAFAIGAAVFLVADVMYGLPAAGMLSGSVAVVLVSAWFVVPIWRRMRDDV
jgi:uncharacterized protein DUF6328